MVPEAISKKLEPMQAWARSKATSGFMILAKLLQSRSLTTNLFCQKLCVSVNYCEKLLLSDTFSTSCVCNYSVCTAVLWCWWSARNNCVLFVQLACNCQGHQVCKFVPVLVWIGTNHATNYTPGRVKKILENSQALRKAYEDLDSTVVTIVISYWLNDRIIVQRFTMVAEFEQ